MCHVHPNNDCIFDLSKSSAKIAAYFLKKHCTPLSQHHSTLTTTEHSLWDLFCVQLSHTLIAIYKLKIGWGSQTEDCYFKGLEIHSLRNITYSTFQLPELSIWLKRVVLIYASGSSHAALPCQHRWQPQLICVKWCVLCSANKPLDID